MTVAALSIVPGAKGAKGPESMSDRVRRLQSEARDLARDHVSALEQALVGVARLASEIAEGGEAYPVGARQIARQLIAECDGRAQTLDAILARTGRA